MIATIGPIFVCVLVIALLLEKLRPEKSWDPLNSDHRSAVGWVFCFLSGKHDWQPFGLDTVPPVMHRCANCGADKVECTNESVRRLVGSSTT